METAPLIRPISRDTYSPDRLPHGLQAIVDRLRFGSFLPLNGEYANPIAVFDSELPLKANKPTSDSPIVFAKSISSGSTAIFPLETDIISIDEIDDGAALVASFDTTVYVGGIHIGPGDKSGRVFRYVDPYTLFPFVGNSGFHRAANKLSGERAKLAHILIVHERELKDGSTQRKIEQIKSDKIHYATFRTEIKDLTMESE